MSRPQGEGLGLCKLLNQIDEPGGAGSMKQIQASHRPREHGLSLADAALLDIDAAFVPDERRIYGEARFQDYGMIHGRLHVLAFTMRHGALRAISLRKANPKE